MGIHRLDQEDAVGAQIKIWSAAVHHVEPISHGATRQHSSQRRKSIRLSVSHDRTAVCITVLSVEPHSKAGRAFRLAATRFAALICELLSQSWRLSVCRAGPARASACAYHAAICASDAGDVGGGSRARAGYGGLPGRRLAQARRCTHPVGAEVRSLFLTD